MNGKTPPLIRFAKATYGRFLRMGSKVSLDNRCGVDLKGGPYLILLNHVGIMDPVMTSAVMPKHIRWVAGAYLFKSRFLNLVIGEGCTAIPKQQGRSDYYTVRSIQRALKSGDNVGLFPEGTRTWDGDMMPVDYGVLAKMVRFFKVPVLFMHIKGGYAHQPRWAEYGRKGKVIIEVSHFLTPEQVGLLDNEALQTTLAEYLHFSNDEWKTTVKYDYRCQRRAEGIHRLLYLCPSCNGLDTIHAQGNRIQCSSCGAAAVLNDMDNLTSVDVSFKLLSQWHSWERSRIFEMKTFPPEPGVLFQKGDADDSGTLETISTHIAVRMDDDAMVVTCNEDEKEYRLPLSEVSSLVLNAKQTMELFCGKDLYRIRLLPNACSLKYHEYYLKYKENA